jgi:hypothetical protein
MQTDIWTDMTKQIVMFRYFVNTFKNHVISLILLSLTYFDGDYLKHVFDLKNFRNRVVPRQSCTVLIQFRQSKFSGIILGIYCK